jgi:hypothetical protein
MVRENLRIAQSRHKRYAEHTRRELSFGVRNYMYLKVSPMRGLRCFKVRGKLAPRYIGLFKIKEEGEEKLKIEFLNFFPIHLNLEGEIHFKGVGLSHPKISNFLM